MQTKWASEINPVLGTPLLAGTQLKGIVLVIGDNQISTKLSRPYQGWIITGMRTAFTQLFEKPSTQPGLTLILNSTAVAVIDLWVY